MSQYSFLFWLVLASAHCVSANKRGGDEVASRNPLFGPLAVARSASVAIERSEIVLDGTASVGRDGPIASYHWRQLVGPDTPIPDPAAARVSVVAPDVVDNHNVRFELRVVDVFGTMSIAYLSVLVADTNEAPVASATASPSTVLGTEPAQLSAVESTDADGEIVAYRWEQEAGPAVELADVTAATATFSAPDASLRATLRFALTVTDNEGRRGSARVSMVVEPKPGALSFATVGPPLPSPPPPVEVLRNAVLPPMAVVVRTLSGAPINTGLAASAAVRLVAADGSVTLGGTTTVRAIASVAHFVDVFVPQLAEALVLRAELVETPAIRIDSVVPVRVTWPSVWPAAAYSTEQVSAHAVTPTTLGVALALSVNAPVDIDFGVAEALAGSLASSRTAVVVRYDSAGQLAWTDSWDAEPSPSGKGLSVSALHRLSREAGDFVLVGGTLDGRVDLNPDRTATAEAEQFVTPQGPDDLVLLFVSDVDGTLGWARAWGGPGSQKLRAVASTTAAAAAADLQDSLLVAGTFAGTLDLDPCGVDAAQATSAHAAHSDLFVSRLNGAALAAGCVQTAHVWTYAVGGEGDDSVAAVASDSEHAAVYLAGTFAGTVDFNSDPAADQTDSRTTTSATLSAAFLVKLDESNGRYRWARSLHGANGATGQGVAVDARGMVYLAGTFAGALSVHDGAASRVIVESDMGGGRDAYVAAFDSAGALLFTRVLGGAGIEDVTSIAARNDGPDSGALVCGRFTDTVDFSGRADAALTRTATAGEGSAFLVALSATGRTVWVDTWESDSVATACRAASASASASATAASVTWIFGDFVSTAANDTVFDLDPAPATQVPSLMPASGFGFFLARLRADDGVVVP